jgi:hypothetical protein
MARTIQLTDPEAQLLSDIVGWWLEGFKEAKEAMAADDRTLTSMEQMLDATSGLEMDEHLLNGVREKLTCLQP